MDSLSFRGVAMSLIKYSLIAVLISLGVPAESHAQSLFGSGGTNTEGGATGGQGQQTPDVDTTRTLGESNFSVDTGDGSLGATVGEGGFVGVQNNGEFAGNRFAGQTASQGTQAQFNNQQNNNQNQNRNNQNTTNRKPVRPRFRIAFSAPIIPLQQVQSQLRVAAINLPPIARATSSIDIQVDTKGMVTLSGSVATLRERKLLESYVRMEPGVRGVSNKISVKN
jgi:hypothetical protein